MSTDANSKLQTKLCSKLRDIVKTGKEWGSYLDCSSQFLRAWFTYHFNILRVFSGVELSWEKYNEWDIDHVVPCKWFDLTDETQQKICFHWSNLAPLPKSINSSKGAKLVLPLIRRQFIMSKIFIHISGHKNKTVMLQSICIFTGALDTADSGKLELQQHA